MVLALASAAVPAAEPVRAEPEIQPELPAAPEAVARADLALAAKVRLAPAKAREVQGTAGGASGVPLQVGYPRSVPALALLAFCLVCLALLAWRCAVSRRGRSVP